MLGNADISKGYVLVYRTSTHSKNAQFGSFNLVNLTTALSEVLFLFYTISITFMWNHTN